MYLVLPIQFRFSPSRLYEYVRLEHLLDRVDVAEFHKHQPDVDSSLLRKRNTKLPKWMFREDRWKHLKK